MKMLLNLQMVMHEPWKASAPEVYLLTTTDGSVPRGLDPNYQTLCPCTMKSATIRNQICTYLKSVPLYSAVGEDPGRPRGARQLRIIRDRALPHL